jgi:hypothetical protein
MIVQIIQSIKGGIKEGQIKDLPIPTAEKLISKGLAIEYSESENVDEVKQIKKTNKKK